MKIKLDTLTGACVVDMQNKRPDSFLSHATQGSKTFVCFPSRTQDFEVAVISEHGAIIPAPIEASMVISRFFELRGIPASALTLTACTEKFEIPYRLETSRYVGAIGIKCKPILANSVDLSGGMPHLLYTEGGAFKTRIIEAPSETDISRDLLRRIRVVKGLPDAVRSIAFREGDEGYRIAISDEVLTLDSVLPMISMAYRRRRVGKVAVACRGVGFEFELRDTTGAEALMPYGGFFGAFT